MNFMALAQQSWQNLSDSNRALWFAVAAYTAAKQKKNPKASLNAHQLFLRYQNIRQWAGLAILETPSFSAFDYVDPEPRLYRDGASIKLEIQSGVYSDDIFALFRVTNPLKNSNYYFNRFLKVFRVVPPVVDFVNMDNIFMTFYGAIPAAGDQIGFSMRLFSILSPDIKAESVYRLVVQPTP